MISLSETISVPVVTDSKYQFTIGNKKLVEDITHRFHQVISKTAEKVGLFDKYGIDEFFIREVIFNAFDAFADSEKFKTGNQLDLKLVIKETATSVKIKLKDNGTGFPFRAKGERYQEVKKSEFTDKELQKTGHFGGQRMGTYIMKSEADIHGTGLEFKNRKKVSGATVTWTVQLPVCYVVSKFVRTFWLTKPCYDAILKMTH